MASRENIHKILELAIHAPSGDNAQPWCFEVRGDVIDIFNIPGKDYSPYNFQERGSFFAHGAVVENIAIAASSFGYGATIDIFPTPADGNHVAKLTLGDTSQNANINKQLAACIESRVTNRKPYRKVPLEPKARTNIEEAFHGVGFGKLLFLEDSKNIQNFAKTVSISDQLIFEEKSIHDAIFDSIRWTTKEEEARRGLYIKTLELPPPARILFKRLQNWSFLALMNNIRVAKFIASQSAKVFAAASAIGMIVIPDSRNISYVRAGMAFERLWLCATEIGLSIQPVTALAYLAERIMAGDAGELTKRHSDDILAAQNHIRAMFGSPQGTIAMMFRMGYGDTPSAHSRKSAPQIKYF
jgi:nitroreductase